MARATNILTIGIVGIMVFTYGLHVNIKVKDKENAVICFIGLVACVVCAIIGIHDLII